MVSSRPSAAAATAKQIREIVGPLDDSVITSVLGVGATCDEIREAFAWLGSDDYLHRKLKHTAHGRVAEVIELLEEELPSPDRR